MEFEGEIIATQSWSEGLETPETVTVTNSSSDNMLEFELTLTLIKGFEAEQSLNILLLINLKSETAVKLRCKALVWFTIRSNDEEGKVAETQEIRKKKTKMGTCLSSIEEKKKKKMKGKLGQSFFVWTSKVDGLYIQSNSSFFSNNYYMIINYRIWQIKGEIVL